MSTIKTGQTGCSNIADSLVGIGIELQTFLDRKQTLKFKSRASENGTQRSFAGWRMNDSEVPTTDTRSMEVRGNLRAGTVTGY